MKIFSEDRIRHIRAVSLLYVGVLLLVLPNPAFAYIGPGAGLGAIAVTIAVILGVLFLVVGLVWFPLKRMIKGRKKGVNDNNELDPTQ
ncbi:hypothetical protein [Ruegeria lacuscaerulensis]|uniref:hypothetical protein n=1 Tax=Ruegeria lacuscaerulensis TaxID=55218 RepID=UPI0015808145|nr:hypothetical protein [Ruegeria lacuscaerulensis]